MSNLIKKENISIIIGTYTNKEGQEKKQYRTIGELITMQGDDGQPYQFGKLWGAAGCTEIKVYPQDDNRTTGGQQPAQQTPQQTYQQAPQQQTYQTPPKDPNIPF